MGYLQRVISKLKKYELGHNSVKLITKDQYLELSFNGQRLTRDICLHSALLVNGSWYSSAQGVWQVAKKDEGLFITMDWKKIPLRQIWQLRKTNSGFNWLVYMDVKEPVKIEKMLCGIMLRQDYENWISATEEGSFPAFNKSWENIFLQDSKGKLLGVKNVQKFPAVIFENLQHGVLLLQNSPAGEQSRALRIEVDSHNEQFEPNRYKPFNLNIYLFPKEEKTADFLSLKNKQLLEERQLREGKLKLSLEHSTVHLYWDEKKLTINQGLHAALQVNNEWFDSSKADWKIERINDQCIYIDIDWRPLPITQSWQLTVKNSTSFEWKVKTDLKEKRTALITKMSLGLVLNPDYKEWLGGYDSGKFPQNFGSWKEMIEDRPEGAIGLKNTDKLPGLLFKNADKSQAKLLVQNGDKNSGARFLQSIGESGFDFHQQINIVENLDDIEALIKEKMDQEILTKGISVGDLKLVCGKGKVRIFWKDKEITTDIGLHSAVCSGGRWYDSGKMKWGINKLSAKKLRIEVDFNPLPVIQAWELDSISGNVFSWNISMKLAKPVEITEHKAGIILNGAYKEWFNSFEEGKFPEKFSYWHDIIRNRDGETFGTYPVDELPGVMLSLDEKHLSLIQNTDEFISGRVFQGQVVETEETKLYEKQEFNCFSGVLKFVEDRNQILEYKQEAQPLAYRSETVYLYADSAFLHNRIAGVDDFEEKIKKIKALTKKNKNFKITIGVSRYNFFKLEQVLKFALSLKGKNIDLRSSKLNILPLRRLRRNSIEYLEELKKIAAEEGGINFTLNDRDFFKMITSVCAQADAGNERQLLRLLGVLCEHAFIGPAIIVIDPYHRCNANCIHCWVHTPGVTHPKEYYEMKLDFDKFKAIADDLGDLMVDLIIFQGDGEPLMHDRFFDMVRYARDKGIQVSFFTNGILLNKANAENAIQNGITEIFCSLPAGSAKTFAKINTKQNEKTFDDVLRNLKYLCDLKKKKSKNKPRLIMTHVIHNQNAHELVEMAQNDIEIGADVMRFYLIRLDENIEFLKLKPKDLEKIKSSLDQIKELAKGRDIELLDTTDFQLENFEEDTGSWSGNVFLEKGCTLGWNFCLIPASGEVSFCCHLRTVGYLAEKSFKDIWNSADYQRFRYQAKFLSENSTEKFLNGTSLFDEYCRHCDTHQVIRDVWDQVKLYNLEEFYRG
ncbi:MAG: radical SAM protein [Candidatus Omnitrophica bacterium]|nr:radical SAM protein [Candidatus Omnitrophota bacterium]